MSKYGKGDQTMMTKDKHTDNDQTMMTKDKHTDKDQKRQLPFYKSGQLQGKYRCVIRRQHNFPLERGKQEAQTIGKAIVMKELITDCLRSGILDEAHIQQKLEEMFQSMAFPTRATADAYAKEAYLQIKRYVTGELHQLQRLEGTQWVPVSPLFLEENRGKKRRLLSVALPETFTPFGLFSLEVKPDLVFYGEKEYIREKIVTGPRGRKKKGNYSGPTPIEYFLW